MAFNSIPRLKVRPVVGATERGGDRSSLAACRHEWDGLMVAAQDGHGGAYQRLLAEISDWLHRYFQRRLPVADVDDAVQETLLAIHRRRHTYDARYPLGPWLAAIAKCKWIDQLRMLGRRPAEELGEQDGVVEDHESAVTSASVLAALLGELRPAQAQAIMLVKLQGYSIEDVSRETGQSLSAVKMNIHRGLGRLTAIIETAHDVE